MNWEFLLGLMLPAYGVGYVWLIKMAREDPVMYAEVEAHLRRLLWATTFAILVVGMLMWKATGITAEFKKEVSSLFAIALLLINIVQQSFPFFRRIAALPPKTSSAAIPVEMPNKTRE